MLFNIYLQKVYNTLITKIFPPPTPVHQVVLAVAIELADGDALGAALNVMSLRLEVHNRHVPIPAPTYYT